MTVSECVERIATCKRANTPHFPLILRYTNRHYSAYVHCTLPGPSDSVVSVDDGSSEDMDISEGEISDEEMKGEDDGQAGVVGAATQPRWGDINELSTRLAASAITYTLPRDIQLIFRCSAASRDTDLLDFLVNTVVAFSPNTQLRLLAKNLQRISSADTLRLQLEYNISDTVFNQWQSWAAERGLIRTSVWGTRSIGSRRVHIPSSQYVIVSRRTETLGPSFHHCSQSCHLRGLLFPVPILYRRWCCRRWTVAIPAS